MRLRNILRATLRKFNNSKALLQGTHPIVRMFDPDIPTTPKEFLEIIVSYLHTQKIE